jgi:hypothetical protein
LAEVEGDSGGVGGEGEPLETKVHPLRGNQRMEEMIMRIDNPPVRWYKEGDFLKLVALLI